MRKYFMQIAICDNEAAQQNILLQLLKEYMIKHQIAYSVTVFNNGEDFLKNGDYYSFLTHIAQKQRYGIRQMYEKPETFLENLIIDTLTEEEKEHFWNMEFDLEFIETEELKIPQGDTEFRITNLAFHRCR